MPGAGPAWGRFFHSIPSPAGSDQHAATGHAHGHREGGHAHVLQAPTRLKGTSEGFALILGFAFHTASAQETHRRLMNSAPRNRGAAKLFGVKPSAAPPRVLERRGSRPRREGGFAHGRRAGGATPGTTRGLWTCRWVAEAASTAPRADPSRPTRQHKAGLTPESLSAQSLGVTGGTEPPSRAPRRDAALSSRSPCPSGPTPTLGGGVRRGTRVVRGG